MERKGRRSNKAPRLTLLEMEDRGAAYLFGAGDDWYNGRVNPPKGEGRCTTEQRERGLYIWLHSNFRVSMQVYRFNRYFQSTARRAEKSEAAGPAQRMN